MKFLGMDKGKHSATTIGQYPEGSLTFYVLHTEDIQQMTQQVSDQRFIDRVLHARQINQYN